MIFLGLVFLLAAHPAWNARHNYGYVKIASHVKQKPAETLSFRSTRSKVGLSGCSKWRNSVLVVCEGWRLGG
jgi:hypothetical protein